MKTIRLEIELEYDDELWYDDDAEDKEYFFDEILLGEESELILHSNLSGEAVGDVKITKILGETA